MSTDSRQLNEFRKDPVSGDWVLFATGRRKGHESSPSSSYTPKEGCPFEDVEGSGNEVIKYYPSKENWSAVLIKNKYPSVIPGVCTPVRHKGPYELFDALGSHELLITKDHDIDFPQLSAQDAELVLSVLQDRYLEIAPQNCGQYISMFNNRGKEAGASIYHPHFQIISTPILPPDIMRSIAGSDKYYRQQGRKVHDMMIEWEVSEGKRIIEQNERFISLCPFVSKMPYEIRVFPKASSPCFEKTPKENIPDLAGILQSSLRRLDKVTNGLARNFFIHTAPVHEENMGAVSSNSYHWHIEIFPHFSTSAGFEIGTGVVTNIVDPDEAARELRDVVI